MGNHTVRCFGNMNVLNVTGVQFLNCDLAIMSFLACLSGHSIMGGDLSFCLLIVFSLIYSFQHGFMDFYIFVGYNPLLR